MPQRAASLMLQGTASHVGKTVLTAALCRLFRREGWRVAPFKAQNLSLNAVIAVGALPGEPPGEIGWAQALQAAACHIAPSLDMNPILLKPTSGRAGVGGCQLVLRGRAVATLGAGDYGRYAPEVVEKVRAALDRLRASHDVVILEGAGSPAEINLLDRDLANRWTADAADAPVLLVGDISRGGVFASLLGTWMLSPHPERIRGFVVNKLHGGGAALASGLRELERRTGVPTLGVIPWRPPELPEEDSSGLDTSPAAPAPDTLRIGVVRLPHIANFTDFHQLARTPGVYLFYSRQADELRAAHVLILPGSKSTVADLEALRAAGLDRVLLEAAAAGKPILGICAGYQMMGREIRDPGGVESDHSPVAGLGLLPVVTEFSPEKRTERVRARDPEGVDHVGYFIHAGRSQRRGGEPWFILADGSEEGCRCDRLAGTALHGVVTPVWVESWRKWAGLTDLGTPPPQPSLDQRLDRWADHVRAHLDWERVQALVRV
ncbi:MAG TPA: cobyric acid synthase [Terriglobales bacterium]|nr:cobyric acid synthase [Terriglobales bacterium]